MRFAFKTAPQHTTWPDMLDVWRAADDIEVFESGWTFDHFYPIFSDSTGPCLEGWTMLTALAQATRRLRLGTLVTGIHYRHPAVLANMAATLDIISGGRLELGMGAGLERAGVRRLRHRAGHAAAAQRPLRGGVRGDPRPAQPRRRRRSAARTTSSTRPGASPSRCSGRTRRSASAAAASGGPCARRPGSPSTGTSCGGTPAEFARKRGGAAPALRRRGPGPVARS